MSAPLHDTIQNALVAPPEDARTPNGSRILAYATPSPLPQNENANTSSTTENLVTASAAAESDGSPVPSVIRDTFDQQTPSPHAPPLTQIPRPRLRLNTGVPALTGGEEAQDIGQNNGPVPLRGDDEAEPSTPGTPNTAYSPPPSPWGSSTTRCSSRSSSPMSFDWDTSATSVEDEGPPSLTRNAVQRAAPTAPAGPPRTFINPVDAFEHLHPLAAERERMSQAGSDYFTFFSTPPAFEDPAYLTQHRLLGAPRYDDEGDHPQIPAGQDTHTRLDSEDSRAWYHGKQACMIPRLDDARNARKRLWTGSPDPEDALRGRRRQRQSIATPPRQGGGGGLSGSFDVYNRNPWGSVGGQGIRTRVNRDTENAFAPVAVSTPAPATVHDRNGPPLTFNFGPRTASRMPESRPDASSPPDPNSTPRTTHRQDEYGRIEDRSLTPVPRNRRMDIDPVPENTRSDSAPAEPKRDKGKARALSPDAEQGEASTPLPDRMDGGWSEQELLEARQRSLRHAVEDRSGTGRHPLTDSRWAGNFPSASQPRAGPSGTQGQNASRVDGAGTSERTLREDRTSHVSRSTRLSGRPRDENTPYVYGFAPRTPHRQTNDASGRSRRYPSEYIPAPNTRAAQHMAGWPDARMHNASPPLSQRSPLSRIPGLQRSPARNSRPRDGDRSGPRDRVTRDSVPVLYDMQMPADEEANPEVLEDDLPGWHLEDGEVIPAALAAEDLEDEEEPTDVPEGGFPIVHRDDPETSLAGMARDWTREVWSDPPLSDVLVEVYNYQYSEEDTFNRRVADNITRHFEGITGEEGFDVVPPEPEEGLRLRARELPTMWAVRGLSPRGVARATARSVWSFPSMTFFTSPRVVSIQTWLFMVEGFLRGDDQKIRAAILRVLGEEEMMEWLERMIGANPDFAGWPLERAVQEVVSSLRVDTLQLGNGNFVSNIHMRSPTRDVREWRRWVAHLRSRRYRSFSIGTGRVRPVIPCTGCRSVAHPSHLCPFPRTRGWNGPEPGQGVFGERRTGNDTRRAGSDTRRGVFPVHVSRVGGGGNRGHLPRRDDERGNRRDNGPSSRAPGRGGYDDQYPRSRNGPGRGRGGGKGGSGSGSGGGIGKRRK
ncbi:hypothetical protein C8T65DRAFT_694499 [Cerioporus squamosus]|nr:hypothetical protein C8T65DRAFT_694499 [Cerioporus squamosus]